MNSQPFNRWRDRFRYGIDAVKRAEAETGEAKGHFFNVTANSTEEALRRLEYIASQGSRYIMYDFLTAGFAASADVFKRAGELGVIVHCHRAMHAVFTRQKDHGIHMRIVAKWLRLVGGDHLHTGTVVGKLEGSRAGDPGHHRPAARAPRSGIVRRAGLYFEQDFAGLKSDLARGFRRHSRPEHPGPVRHLRERCLLAFRRRHARSPQGQPRGGPGQPRRHRSGRLRQDPREAAQTCPELREAMELWGNVKFASRSMCVRPHVWLRDIPNWAEVLS